MARSRTERFLVTRVDASTSRRGPDDLVVEEPMRIALDGVDVTTTMRTPGHDFELAAGFCFTDGLLAGAPIRSVRYCANAPAGDRSFNEVTVTTDGTAPAPSARLGNVSSSCGWCGNDQIDELTARLDPLPARDPIAPQTLSAVVESMAKRQTLFAATGAVHAAASFTAEGEVLTVREDVGRHNAVDKVVGSMLLADGPGLPAHGLGLFVSGRASVEMVQKAWAAGFTTLVSVSAPTALAVHTARRAGLDLYGFARPPRLNRYT